MTSRMTLSRDSGGIPPGQPVPTPNGLAALLMAEGPDTWHEFALGLNFADVHAGFDLLLAADRITRDPRCDRATAALLLARMAEAGFHLGQAPAALDPVAAGALTARLEADLRAGAYARARLGLPHDALLTVIRMLGLRGPMPLGALGLGRRGHRPRYGFAGWRPVALPRAAGAATG